MANNGGKKKSNKKKSKRERLSLKARNKKKDVNNTDTDPGEEVTSLSKNGAEESVKNDEETP
ncbi:MAG: hypothetical protein V3T17_06595 [Pseudomonadales bacterium]